MPCYNAEKKMRVRGWRGSEVSHPFRGVREKGGASKDMFAP